MVWRREPKPPGLFETNALLARPTDASASRHKAKIINVGLAASEAPNRRCTPARCRLCSNQVLLERSPQLRAPAVQEHPLIGLANGKNVTDLVRFQTVHIPQGHHR